VKNDQESKPAPKIPGFTYTSQKGKFRAVFPVQPEEKEEPGFIDVDAVSFEKGAAGTYSITCMTLEKDADRKELMRKAIEHSRKRLESETRKHSFKQKEILFGKHPGVELLMEFEEPGFHAFISANRLFIVGSHFYSVTYKAIRQNYNAEQGTRFLDSFEVLD
jgi:hypothetical protein